MRSVFKICIPKGNTVPKKYSNLLASIHWIHAALLLVLLLTGGLILSNMPNTAEKIGSLQGHMLLGFAAGIIAIVRLILVLKSPKLTPLNVSAGRMQIIAWNHRLIYLFIFLVALSGMAAAKLSGTGDIVFFGKEGELFANMSALAENAKWVHMVSTKILMALIVMHIAGIVSYIIKTKENVLKRVGFGQP
jgi:cytochrome b561